MIAVSVDVSVINDVLNDFGVPLDDGEAKGFVMEDVLRLADPYTPMYTGLLKNTATVSKDAIEYNEPYAAFVWFGKLMLGEETNSPFAKKDEKKYTTNEDLHYRGEPKRGPKWIERMWAEKQDQILDDLVEFLKSKGY